MSISLNNHESRIKALEGSSATIQTNPVANGYMRVGNLLFQWGSTSYGNSSSSNVKIIFPKTFTTTPFYVCAAAVKSSGSLLWQVTQSVTNTGFTFLWNGYNGNAVSSGCNWIAIGILYTYRYIIKSAQKFAPLSYLFNKEV